MASLERGKLRCVLCAGVTVVALTLGCAVELTVPSGVQIACEDDSECPEGFTCAVGECVVEGFNGAPSLTLAPIVRSIGDVFLEVTVFDLESDDVTLALELDRGSGFEPEPSDLGTLASSPDGVTATVAWQPSAALSPAVYTGDLRLRVTPSDASGSGPAVTSGTFAYGNTSPQVSEARIEDDPVRGIAILKVTVIDNSNDPVDIDLVELSVAGDFSDTVELPISTVTFPVGQLSGLTSSPAGIEHALGWDSRSAAVVDAASAALRLRVRDGFAASNVRATSAFVIDNVDTPPSVAIETPSGTDTGLVAVPFTLQDADGDPALVIVEFSIDNSPYELAATNTDVVGIDPGDYIFEWQSTQLGFEVYSNVRLRFTPSDSAGSGTEVITDPFVVDNRTLLGNAPPSVFLGAIERLDGGRYLDVVDVPLLVSDPNVELVDLTLEFSTDYDPLTGTGTWNPMTPAAGSPSLTGVAATTVGVAIPFVWDALADAQSGVGGLTTSNVDTDGDEAVDTEVVDQVRGVFVRASAADRQDPPLASPRVMSASLALGDRAITSAIVSNGGVVSGEIPIEFTLTDPAPPDVATLVELEFSDDGGTTWRAADISLGTVQNLATRADGQTYVVVWSSATPANASPAVAQGVGPVDVAVTLRLRAVSEPVPGQPHYGAYSSPVFGPINVDNQSPPRVAPAFVKSDGALHNGLVPITYRLLDEEGDPADVLFEVSVDEGQSWAPCVEAFVSSSEGVEDLAASPAGVEHTYVWDSAANIALFAPSVRLRVTAAGSSSGAGEPTELVQQRPVGLASGASHETLFADSVEQVTSGSIPYSTVGDLDADGIVDLISVRLDGDLEVRLGNGASAWDGSFGAATTVGLFADGGAVGVGDVTCDGLPDVVAATDGNYFSGGGSPDVVHIFAGVGGGALAEYTGSPITTGRDVEDLFVIDLDDDGDLDFILMERFGGATAFYSDGAAPNCAFAETADLDGSGGLSFGVGYLDNDRYVDVVFGGGDVFFGEDPAGGSRFTQAPDLSNVGSAVHLADVDGDGDDDVIGAVTGEIRAARSDGARGFELFETVPGGGPSPNYIQTTDLNRDGLLDILTVNFGGAVSALLAVDSGGEWEGGFVEAFELPLKQGLQPKHILITDLDEDGLDDLVVSDRSGGVETFLGVDASAFGPASLRGAQTFPTTQFTSKYAAPADFDLDGAPDLLITGQDATILRAVRSGRTSTALLTPAEDIDFSDDVPYPALGDFDGDGLLDMVIAHPALSFSFSSATTASLLIGQPRSGGATFTAGTPPSLSTNTELARCTLASHINDDDLLDVLIVTGASDGSTSTARPFLGQVGGGFAAGPTTALGAGLYYGSVCELGDVNGDSRLDLFLGTGTVWRQLSTGALVSFGSFPSAGFGKIAVTDFNRDGIIDIIRGGGTSRTAEVYRGNGSNGISNGTYTLVHTTPDLGDWIRDMEPVDLDGDGIVDMLVTTQEPRFKVVLGNGAGGIGDGTFGAPIDVAAATASYAFATTFDANGDWTPDLAAVDSSLTLPEALTVVTAMRTAARLGWVRRVGGGATSLLFGADTGPTEQTLLGLRQGSAYTQLPFRDSRVGELDRADGSVTDVPIFLQHLRGTQLAGVPANLTPVTAPWTWYGARQLVRVEVADGLRLEVRERFGPRVTAGDSQREGLDLAGAPQRGVIVELPILPGRSAVSGKVRVFARTLDFTRAQDWPGDALAGLPGGAAVLPRIDDEDVVLPVFTWLSLAEQPLDSGTGPRFEIDSARGVIRALLDRDATLQAFRVP